MSRGKVGVRFEYEFRNRGNGAGWTRHQFPNFNPPTTKVAARALLRLMLADYKLGAEFRLVRIVTRTTTCAPIKQDAA